MIHEPELVGGTLIFPTPEPEDPSCAEVKAQMETGAAIIGRESPRCLANGHFHPVQCRGSQCFCVDCAGLQLKGYEPVNRGEAEKLHCVCAREKHEFGRSGMVGRHFRCTENGNYASYQCSGTGCYCTNDHGEYIKTDVLGTYFLRWETEGKEEFCQGLQ